MKRRIFRNIVILAALSLIGIISIQIYWVGKAFNQQEKLFNQRVHVALTNVTSQILKLNNDSSELYEPIKQIGSNYFIASINDTLHPYLLESLLKNEFLKRNIKLDFEYVIYDCFTDSIVYGRYITFNEKDIEENEDQATTKNRKWEKDGHYYGVYFPNKATYLVNQMGIWIFSSVILLIVMIYFSYTTYIILKQKRLSEIKTDFINNITHELKTPISTIGLSVDVLLSGKAKEDEEKLNNYARIIKDENKRLKTQVNKVLQIATLDKGEIELEIETISIHKLLEKSASSFELIIKNREGQLEMDLKAVNDKIEGDAYHLSNIFFNLFDNAIKYSPEDVYLHVSTSNVKKGIEIQIEDHGMGIEKKDFRYVFEKFYRVPTGNKHDVKGFGLGLYYVKTIIDELHGTVRIESEKEKGSKFILYIPHKQ